MPEYARARARERICISLLRALAHRSLPGWFCNMQTCRHNQSPSLSLSSIALSGRSFCSNNILCAANHTSFHTHASCIMHCVSQSIIRTRVKLFAIWHEYQFWNSPRTRTGMSEQREREIQTNSKTAKQIRHDMALDDQEQGIKTAAATQEKKKMVLHFLTDICLFFIRRGTRRA